MDSSELRTKFLSFFEKHGHKIVPSSSLLPTDSSVLFTTAGMQQFKPYYLGEPSPYGNRVASCQKCFRTSDIEEVGDERHLTFFEMLGNFSFAASAEAHGEGGAGYFKEEAIKLAKEFLDELKIEIDYVTVFEGDENTPKDEESAKIWGELGFSESKGNLRFENKKENFWGPTGEEGPCGPTTEIYSGGIEIWNIVFNQYYSKNGKLELLETPGIDTGMGLERLAKVMQKAETVLKQIYFCQL
jgi:alanyl-tRNA synthetase